MTQDQIAQIVEQAVEQRLRALLSPPSRFMDDDEVCELLRIKMSKLRSLIATGDLVQGAHFTGDPKSRIWIRDRVERYILTRDNPAAQTKDVKAWLKG